MQNKEKVFVLQHVHIPCNDIEDVKLIGVYSSEESAKKAIDRLRHQPGFRDYPNLIDPLVDKEREGFNLDACELDKDHWVEGFITVSYDDKDENE